MLPLPTELSRRPAPNDEIIDQITISTHGYSSCYAPGQHTREIRTQNQKLKRAMGLIVINIVTVSDKKIDADN